MHGRHRALAIWCVVVVAAMVEKGEPGAPDNSRLVAVSNLKYILDENLTRQCADFTIATVNWLPTFWDGVIAAQKQDMPILLWAMNGHPLACT